MPDEPDPPRQHYGFKEREFQRDNVPGTPASPTAQEHARAAGFHFDPRPRAAAPKAGDPNDVFKVLEQNRRTEQQHNLDAIEIRKVRSRRVRDYLILLAGGNLLIVGMVALLGLNLVTVLFGFGGVIVFSVGVTWIMWQVMGRY